MEFDSGLLQQTALILTPILTSLAAILAWYAKIRWSKEYEQLAQQRLATVEAGAAQRVSFAEFQLEYWQKQAHSLIELAPEKISAQFEMMRSLDRQRITELEEALALTRADVRAKEAELEQLREAVHSDRSRSDQLEDALNIARQQVSYITEQLSRLADRDSEIAAVINVIQRPEFRMDTVRAFLSGLESQKKWALSDSALRAKERRAHAEASQRAALRAQEERKARAEHQQTAAHHLHAPIPNNDAQKKS